MSGVRVRDSRATPSVCLAKADLSILGERLEKRRLAPTRSAYLALLEASGEPGAWTRKKIADRAGIGYESLRLVLDDLDALGFLRWLEDGSVDLISPSGAGEVPLPVTAEGAGSPEPESPRAAAFYDFHAARVEGIRGGRPTRTAGALAAAEKILSREPRSPEIRARLDWALDHRFYADKVLTLAGFDRWWARINAAYLADRSQASRPLDGRPSVAPSEVSYEGERVGSV